MNRVAMDGISSMGIEVPTDGVNASHDVTIFGNSVDMSSSSLYGVGVSASNGGPTALALYDFTLSSNLIAAPIGFQFIGVRTSAEPNITVVGNDITDFGLRGFIRTSTGADFTLSQDPAVTGNSFTCVGALKLWGVSGTLVPEAGCP